MVRFVSRFLLLACIVQLVFWGSPARAQIEQTEQPGVWEIRRISDTESVDHSTYKHPSISSSGRFISYLSKSTGNSSDNTDQIIVYDAVEDGDILEIPVADGLVVNRAMISPNGRYVLVNTSTTAGPNDSSLHIFDRMLNKFDDRYLQSSLARVTNALSYDGRYLLFHQSDGQDLFLVDRFTGQEFDLYAPEEGDELTTTTISSDSRWIAYAIQSGDTDPADLGEIRLFDRVFQTTQTIYTTGDSIDRLSITSNGSHLAFITREGSGVIRGNILDLSSNQIIPNTIDNIQHIQLTGQGDQIIFFSSQDGGNQVSIQPVETDQPVIQAPEISSEESSFNQTGDHIVFQHEAEGKAAVFLASRNPIPPGQSYFGQVFGAYRTPLATVTVTLGALETKTDHNGNYYFEHITNPDQPVFSKEGYIFSTDFIENNHISAVGVPEGVIDEAELDIGMAYTFDRGCPSPFEPCGGPFHGFYTGYCTDLIFDAYLWGANYNIQTALVRDALNNPNHLYRWRDARNAHDMWRYFAYTGQMIWENEQYAIGDMVFFDWEGNMEIDHVALISEVTASGMPEKMIDATGRIEFNPSGLTAELDWLYFHDMTVRGHARWNGLFTANPIQASRAPVLQNSFLVTKADLNFYLVTQQSGGILNLQLPGQLDLTWETVHTSPITDRYHRIYANIDLAEQPATTTLVTSQIFDDGLIPSRTETEFDLTAGIFHRFTVVGIHESEGITAAHAHIQKKATGHIELQNDQP